MTKISDLEAGIGPSNKSILSMFARGLSRIFAAAYIGISTTFFDQLVAKGKLPPPVKIGARLVWDRFDLDAAFEAMKEVKIETTKNSWDD